MFARGEKSFESRQRFVPAVKGMRSHHKAIHRRAQVTTSVRTDGLMGLGEPPGDGSHRAELLRLPLQC